MHDNIIEYFYSAHSAFAYLGAPRLSQIAQGSGWQVVHRPFDFWPVVDAANPFSIKTHSAAHNAYFFGRELVRWAQWHNLEILQPRPTYHDNPLSLASGVIMAAADTDRMSFAILQAHWRDDADIACAHTLRQIIKDCGEDADALLGQAASDTVQAQFKANTDEAIARSVFGSPTYFVRGDMFYGQDHLDMVARAIEKPFDE